VEPAVADTTGTTQGKAGPAPDLPAVIARAALVPPFHAAARLSDSCADWASHQVRYLPQPLWTRRPLVSARRMGLRFDLDLRDNVQRILYFTGLYERRYLRFLWSQLRPGDVYLDIGAHVGIHAQSIAKRLLPIGGRVVAFEPAPDVASTLRKTCRVNGLSNVDVIPMALGRETSELPLRSDPVRFHEADAAVRSFYGPGEETCVVRVAPFDAWARTTALESLDVVKIDVEGAELAVLEGMEESLSAYKPRLIGLEISDYLVEQAGTTEAKLRTTLSSLDYEPLFERSLEGNFVFTRRGSQSPAACT
jgi:FkbM family methyltransferase